MNSTSTQQKPLTDDEIADFVGAVGHMRPYAAGVWRACVNYHAGKNPLACRDVHTDCIGVMELLEALQGILSCVSVRIDDPRIAAFDAARAVVKKFTEVKQ